VAGTLTLSIRDAVLVSLEHNRALQIQRFLPAMNRTAEARTAAPFDLNLAADVSGAWNRSPTANPDTFQSADKQTLSLGANRFLPDRHHGRGD